MKLVPVFAAVGLSAVLLSGCVASVHEGRYGRTHVDVGLGYGYYDDYYGPYYGGYWGDDDYFYYYTDASRVKVVRDNDRHFRREEGHGFHRVEARREERREERREDRREQRQEDRHDDHNGNH